VDPAAVLDEGDFTWHTGSEPAAPGRAARCILAQGQGRTRRTPPLRQSSTMRTLEFPAVTCPRKEG